MINLQPVALARPWVRALPTYAVAAALVLAWLARLGSGVGAAPLRYLDLVLVPVAFVLAAWLRHEAFLRFLPLLAAGLLFVVAGVLGGVVHGLPLVQIVIGIALYMVPFMACVVVATEPDDAYARRAVLAVAGLCAVQVPLVLAQWLQHGVGDEIRGSLLGAGAGAHLVGAAAVVGAALVWTWHAPPSVVAATSVVALLIIFATDAKQVGAVVPILAVCVLVLRLSARGASKRRLLVVASGVLVLLLGPVLWLLSKTYVANIFRLTVDSGGGKIAVVRTLWADVWSGPVQALVGFGPGETVSRWGWMLTGLDPASAPLTTLGLQASDRAVTYQQAALGQGYVGESSFTQSLSSLLGVLGDYGFLGAIGFGTLLVLVLKALGQVRSRLAAVSVGLIAALVVLGAIGDWLEQTPVTVMVFLLAGVALRSPSTGEVPS